jgi:hypothetical protein
MIKVEDPPGFVVRTEAQKAAYDNGFRLERGLQSGWLCYGSTTVQGEIWLGGSSSAGPWALSIGHYGVAAEIGLAPSLEIKGPGAATFLFASLYELYVALDRTYRLAISLPDAPLRQFRSETVHMPRETETERLVIQRIGQALFRQALLKYWNGRCPLTGITETSLLRASHIVPWADCDTDTLRLDVHNGLLLSALWDAAFDSGLVSFADNGAILVSPQLSCDATFALAPTNAKRLVGLTNAHCTNLARHRLVHGY